MSQITLTSLPGCAPTVTIPFSTCPSLETVTPPNCSVNNSDLACCQSYVSILSLEYACIASQVACFSTSLDAPYKDYCKSVIGAGSPSTATTTNAAATATTTATAITATATATTAATANSPAPTKSGAAGLGGVGRSVSAVAMVVGIFVYLMA